MGTTLLLYSTSTIESRAADDGGTSGAWGRITTARAWMASTGTNAHPHR